MNEKERGEEYARAVLSECEDTKKLPPSGDLEIWGGWPLIVLIGWCDGLGFVNRWVGRRERD